MKGAAGGTMVVPGITVDPSICEGRPHLSGTTAEPATAEGHDGR